MEAAALHRGPRGESPGKCDFAEARRGLTPDGDDDFTAALMGLGSERRREGNPAQQSPKARSRWRFVETLTSAPSPERRGRKPQLSTSPGMTPISLRMHKQIDQCVRIPQPTEHSTAMDSAPGWATTKRQVGRRQDTCCEASCSADGTEHVPSSRRECREDSASGAWRASSSCASAASTPRCHPQDPPADANLRRQLASLTCLPNASIDSWHSVRELNLSLNTSSRTSSSSSGGGGCRRHAHIKPTRHLALILRASLQDSQSAEAAVGSTLSHV